MTMQSCFQRFDCGNRVRCYCQSGTLILPTRCDKYLLLFTTKSKQTSEFPQRRGFNGSTGVIEYAESEYDIVNNM